MPDELVFYTNPMSRGRIVRWMLEEVRAPYRTETLEYGTTMKGADYLAINPLGKVPAIRLGTAVITECAAICAYLADAFPDAGLAPPPAQRAAYYRWLFLFSGPLEAVIINRALGFEVPPGKERMAGYGDFETMMDVVEQAVTASDYIAGDTFSAADVYCGSQVGWGLQFGTLEKRPAFAAYWDRISDRDGYRRAQELDNALLPEA
jgi:glutathione S-transferase